MRNAAAFVQVVNHLCKSQRNFRLTERNFQQLHHLIVGEFFRRNQKTFQHSGTGTQPMHTGLAGQLWYLVFQNFLPVLVVAQLLFCFGFLAAEIGEIGFRLVNGITLLFKSWLYSTFLLVRGTLHTINVNRGDCVACVISKCA